MSDERRWPMALGQEFLRAISDAIKHWDGWPCTIVATRYSGAYEYGETVKATGGDWAAFPVEIWSLTEESWASGDTECDRWWFDAREQKIPVGHGATPQEAYENLALLLRTVDTTLVPPALPEGN